jgi:enhancing lycopene biosynthesis protein 2
MMKIGVLLHGSGVYDGTEIHEAVLTLLAIKEAGHDYQCLAPNIEQHHVANHLDGSEMNEKRNVLIESARIARGEIQDLASFDPSSIDALVMPGGFGTAKNFTKWAFSGPEGTINQQVKNLILAMLKAGKPICALCMSPTTVAKALEGTSYHAKLTVGSTAAPSPYEIEAIGQGMESIGAESVMKTVDQVAVDDKLKIVTAPCYMMEADILQVRDNIKQAVNQMLQLL